MCGPVLSHMAESLNERRARLAKLEANVSRKIGRNRRDKGVILAGTELDPRRDSSKVARYTGKQLAAYERQLREFTSRKTQFEAGTGGAPLPRAQWRAYKASEDVLRAAHEKGMAPVAKAKLPGPGTETVEQRQAKMRTKHPTALNMAYLPPERKPFNVKDLASLIKLTKSNKKRMTKKWATEEHRRARKELKQMVEVFEDADLNNAVKKLTKGQFDILWNFTRFADNLSITYHHYQKKYTPKQQMPQELVDNELAQAKSLIDWVKKFDI